VIDPCLSGVPWTHLPGAVLLRIMSLAPPLRSGHPGKVSDATRRAIHVLCLVYCRCHHAPYPTWDFFAEEVRNPAALDFAFICLRAWWTPGIEGLEPKDVIRSLHNVNSLILTPPPSWPSRSTPMCQPKPSFLAVLRAGCGSSAHSI
jgi:hypothetical protein